MEATLTIRGRQITPNDLTFIQSLIQTHWQHGRKFISRELCHHWHWYQPNGNLKDMALRGVGSTSRRPSYSHYKGCTYFCEECHSIEFKGLIENVRSRILYKLQDPQRITLGREIKVRVDCRSAELTTKPLHSFP